MSRTKMMGVVVLAAMLAPSGSVSGQSGTVTRSTTGSAMQDAQVADLRTMKDKFTQLGAAFSDDQMDWRPMDGTRSVKDVLVLMASEGNLFPKIWGGKAGPGAGADFRAEGTRLSAMSRADLMAALDQAFDNIIESVASMDDAARMKPASWFGTQTNAAAAIFRAQTDMHEHLGQLIAYARANHVVPPWSRGNGQ